MRNCYVYKCDWKHKNNPKRAMFIIPKDPAKFKQWSDVLPKHRRLTNHDRVCEKHFDPADIMRDWSHVIQGETKKVKRCKPNLRPDAVPRYFDLSEAELRNIARKRRLKAPNKQLEAEEKEHETPAEKPSEDEPSFRYDLEESEKNAIFEDVYENIFEVELPSTLWGVHRDPEKKYIAFTRFQMLEMPTCTTSTTLVIESSLKCCAWCDASIVLEEDLCMKMASQEGGEEQPSRCHVISEVLDSLEQLAIVHKPSTGERH
uniref:Uncharacterized protein n=1 Tax=Anopheles atroparvus TaxID=41427 RepID=A0A182J3R2_ANOAO